MHLHFLLILSSENLVWGFPSLFSSELVLNKRFLFLFFLIWVWFTVDKESFKIELIFFSFFLDFSSIFGSEGLLSILIIISSSFSFLSISILIEFESLLSFINDGLLELQIFGQSLELELL